MDLDEFRDSLDAWLDENLDELTPVAPQDTTLDAHHDGVLDAHMAHLSKVKRMTYDAGFMRRGWPERVGGLPGSTLMRAYLGEAVQARGLAEPGLYSMTEVLAPTMIDYASPELAATMVPRLLRGDETWCQGFSEPGTGSNLAALSCKATKTDDGYLVNGQKVWTSLAQYAQRCILLTRTGDADSAHRGITALFVDVDDPGITVRPILTMHGALEFCEVFFDDVLVPFDRMLGDEGQGWGVAMDLLPFERSTSLWHRGAFLHRRFEQLLAQAPDGALDPLAVAEVGQLLYSFRARSRATQYRMASGGTLGPETSVDKVLVATIEQAVMDLALDGLGADIAGADDDISTHWRTEYLYSRSATIYGGSAEIQRNIIARRLLDLGADN